MGHTLDGFCLAIDCKSPMKSEPQLYSTNEENEAERDFSHFTEVTQPGSGRQIQSQADWSQGPHSYPLHHSCQPPGGTPAVLPAPSPEGPTLLLNTE